MLSGKHIYVVEDDELVRQAMIEGLQRAGAVVDFCETGERLLEAARSDPLDVALIDLRLPGRSGLEILGEFRRIADIPAIIVTGQGDEFDEVAGFETGADDFIRKPFVLKVLIARIGAVLRRRENPVGADTAQLTDLLAKRNWQFDSRMRCLIGPGSESVPMTATEVRILSLLAGKLGETLDRAALYEQIFNRELSDQSRTIDVLVSRLRQKLRATRSADCELRVTTTYGRGYSLVWQDTGER